MEEWRNGGMEEWRSGGVSRMAETAALESPKAVQDLATFVGRLQNPADIPMAMFVLSSRRRA